MKTLFLTLIACIVIYGCNNEQKKEKRYKQLSAEVDSIMNEFAKMEGIYEEPQEDLVISAYDIAYTYSKDYLLADRNYYRNTLSINGSVLATGKNMFNEYYIVLKTDLKMLVQCYFIKQPISLKKGQEVIIRGICDGVLKNVLIKECELIEIKE